MHEREGSMRKRSCIGTCERISLWCWVVGVGRTKQTMKRKPHSSRIICSPCTPKPASGNSFQAAFTRLESFLLRVQDVTVITVNDRLHSTGGNTYRQSPVGECLQYVLRDMKSTAYLSRSCTHDFRGPSTRCRQRTKLVPEGLPSN